MPRRVRERGTALRHPDELRARWRPAPAPWLGGEPADARDGGGLAGVPHRHPARRARPGAFGVPPQHELPVGGAVRAGEARGRLRSQDRGAARDLRAPRPRPMGQVRPPDARELAMTAVLEVPIEEASAKIRTGPPKDDPEDLSLPVWAGVLPLETIPGVPLPDGSGGPAEVPLHVLAWPRGR